MKRLIFVTFLYCACGLAMHALALRVFNADHDLSSSLINQLYQDRNGMMWVATEDGLNRYDGNKFTIYRNVPGDSSSLFSSYVKAIGEDEEGRIYACTRRGIQIYDPVSDSFLPRMKEPGGHAFASIANAIVRRKDNEYWAIGNMVRRFAISGPEAFVLKEIDDIALNMRYIQCALTDTQGNLWLAKTESEVYCVTPDNQVRTYLAGKNDPAVSSMTLGSDGQLYVGTTSSGLLRFNSDSDNFEQVSSATNKEIKNLFADVNGDILQATDGDGILVYTPATGETRPLRYGHPYTDSGRQKTHCMMRDADGNMWIGLFQSGVTMLQRQPNSFGYIGHKSIESNLIGRNCISAIFGDSEGTLWIGADNDGIYGLPADGTTPAHFTGDNISVPMSIFEDSRNRLWVGTYLHGVGILDRSTGKMKRVEVNDSPTLTANNCMAMAEDRNHKLWLGMLNSGLMCYDASQRLSCQRFRMARQDRPVDSIIAVFPEDQLAVRGHVLRPAGGQQCIAFRADRHSHPGRRHNIQHG